MRATALGDPALEFWAEFCGLAAQIEWGECEQVAATLERLELIVGKLGQPSLRWFAEFPAAGWALMRGDLACSEELAEEALQIGSDAGEPDAVLVYGAQIAPLRVLQGRGEEVVELIEEGAAAYPRMPAWWAGLAYTYCWLDRDADAATLIKRAAADGFQHVPNESARSSTLALYADAASQAGLAEVAGVMYELIEPWADQAVWNGAAGFGHCRMYLGLLAATLDWDERADEHLAFACETQEANGLLVWAARARLGWAEALAGRGETDRAQAEAARALELSREHCYGAIERRAAAVVETGSAAERRTPRPVTAEPE